jgi:hypothetical protein
MNSVRQSAWSLTAAACVLAASCNTNEVPGGPVEAAVKFFEAKHCSEVFRFYTAGTQENIRAEVHRQERERNGMPQLEVPEERYCGWAEGTLKSGTARIARQQGNETIVAAEFKIKVISSRSFFPQYPTVTKELRLIREGGAWRVERPRVTIGRPHERLTEIGPVDVFQEEKTFWDSHSTPTATAMTRARRDALTSALRDSSFWARVLPSVKSVQMLERAGESERVQLTFEGADQSLTVALQPRSAPSSNEAEAAVLWEVEGGNKAPLYLRGAWRLMPCPDGTRITLHIVFNRRQWPGDAASEIFSAKHLAQAVLNLEKAALKSVR